MTWAFKAYEETLSLRELARRAPDPGVGPSAAQSAALRPRVFVIDDEEGICRFVCTAVSSMDCQADYFTSAAPALSALEYRAPPGIFIDIALGGSDAVEVILMLGQRQYRGVVQLMSGSNP